MLASADQHPWFCSTRKTARDSAARSATCLADIVDEIAHDIGARKQDYAWNPNTNGRQRDPNLKIV